MILLLKSLSTSLLGGIAMCGQPSPSFCENVADEESLHLPEWRRSCDLVIRQLSVVILVAVLLLRPASARQDRLRIGLPQPAVRFSQFPIPCLLRS